MQLTQDVPMFHTFLRGYGVVENVASFTDGASLPVVDLSGDVPNVIPGLLVTESVQINEAQYFVTTKLVTPKLLVPKKFVAPPPFRNFGPLFFRNLLFLFLKLKLWFTGETPSSHMASLVHRPSQFLRVRWIKF